MEISMATDRPISPSRTRPSSRSPKKRPTRSFWIKTLSEFSNSGLSAQAFCRLKNLSASSLSTWRKRLREEESDESLTPVPFIPLEVMPTDSFPDPTKETPHNPDVSFLPDIERRGSDSGLILHVNKDLTISIDKKFHEPTLQRLLQLFSLGNSSPC